MYDITMPTWARLGAGGVVFIRNTVARRKFRLRKTSNAGTQVTRMMTKHSRQLGNAISRPAKPLRPRFTDIARDRAMRKTMIVSKPRAQIFNSPCGVSRLKERMKSWEWREKKINYLVLGDGPPLLLVHGFGASILHFRKNIPILAESFTVYAIDLLGFGGSEKAHVKYTMELWRDLLVDFTTTFIKEPFFIIGNSLGSLAAAMATAEIQERVIGLALLNCAGAMNNKGVKDVLKLRLLMPIFVLIDILLSIKPIARFLFNKLAKEETLRSVLDNVYYNKEAVDDDLVEIFRQPSKDEGALDVFVSVITGPPGPRPEEVLQQLKCPILVLWGELDNMTPIFDNPLPSFLKTWPRAEFIPLTGTGHALHDDHPELVHRHLLPWLQENCTAAEKEDQDGFGP